MSVLSGLVLTVVLGAAPDAGARPSTKAQALATAALQQVGVTTTYDAAYLTLAYPGGDVPQDRGVCTDVVVRAFRAVGVDLQVELHRDMAAHFSSYPPLWKLTRPDANIDHRRVQNLRVWFARRGKELPITTRPEDYWPGDLVTVTVDDRPHIMVVSDTLAPGGERYQVVHNIGAGAQLEDRLFEFPITGHYRPL